MVCRAGASTLAELTALGRGAMLIPFPFAANNHQEYNARFLAAAGAGELILNKDFTGELLAGKIRHLFSHRAALEAIAKEIVRGCMELLKMSGG